MDRRQQVSFAWVYGIVTHLVFVFSVAVMVIGLYSGLRSGLGQLHGWAACAADMVLIAQFPLLHSFFLSKAGRAVLARAMPGGMGADLSTTTYALLAALQLLVAFGLWSPSGITIYEATGNAYWFFLSLYLLSWLFLIKALTDAGLGLQTGYMGWSAVVKGKRPLYKGFPTHGLFRVCRHPVYLGFALVMWTAPKVTLDGLVLASVWSIYCVIGPRLKEARYRAWYGDRYAQYCASVPYMLPDARRLWSQSAS